MLTNSNEISNFVNISPGTGLSAGERGTGQCSGWRRAAGQTSGLQGTDGCTIPMKKERILKKGLILEGGGMRGIFVAGVIDYLLDAGIKFENVLGVSAGACHGCSYVSGQRGRAYATNTDYLDDERYCSFSNLRKTGDLFGAEMLYHIIPEELYPIDNEAFKASGIKFQPVVTNCITGKAEYPVVEDMFRDVEWVRASSSLPFLANMVEVDGGLYMDGGIADSIPLAQSIRQGNEKNLVVLTRPRDYRKKAARGGAKTLMRLKYRDYPNMVEAYANRYKTYNESLELVAAEEAAGRAFVIAPLGPLDIGRTEKNRDKLRKAYQEGYYVAEGLGEKLEAFLRQ